MMKNWITLAAAVLCVFSGLAQESPTKIKDQKIFSWESEIQLLGRIDLLSLYRTDCPVEQISSYDRTGNNNDGFSGDFSFIRKENGHLVLADLQGPGVINRIWTPTPTNDTVSFYFDGEKIPRLRICFSDLFSGEVYPFVRPVCGNEIGGFYSYLPIPYRKSCKIVFESEKIMFHQIQYRKLNGYDVESYSALSARKIKPALEEVKKIWAEFSSKGTRNGIDEFEQCKVVEKSFFLNPGDVIPFFNIQIPGRILGFEIDGGTGFEGIHKDVVFVARWDNDVHDAIYAPVADFFGYAYGKPAMRSLLLGNRQNVNYSSFPMPFDRNARLSLEYKKRSGSMQKPIQVKTKVYYSDVARDREAEGRFYSVWRREVNPKVGEYYTFSRLKGKGHYVGTMHLAQGLKADMTSFFEGDDSTYVDGSMRMHGTGSEDYYNGGWYALLDRWDRGVSLPIHGSLDYSLPMSRTGGYRFYLTDKLSFEKELYTGIEHGPEGNTYPVDYTSVAYYYANAPLTQPMEPTDLLRTVFLPDEHVFYPQLMDLTIGDGVQIENNRGIRIKSTPGGMVRIMLNDLPEGKYKVFISYFEKPEGSEFCIWQRQKRLCDWLDTNSKIEKLKEKVPIGILELTKQTNSLSVHVRKNGVNNEFEIERIYLKRITE